MKAVFVDSAFWIAVARPDDPYRDLALEALDASDPAQLVTTEEVFVEVCAAVGRSDKSVRRAIAQMIRKLLGSSGVTVMAQSHESFLRGLTLYEKRLDKGYSLTDCISMTTMYDGGIREILTTDRHFQQEGFRVLMHA